MLNVKEEVLTDVRTRNFYHLRSQATFPTQYKGRDYIRDIVRDQVRDIVRDQVNYQVHNGICGSLQD